MQWQFIGKFNYLPIYSFTLAFMDISKSELCFFKESASKKTERFYVNACFKFPAEKGLV